jgi:hypothetical protein
MATDTETALERAADKLKDAVGLPPGRFADGTPKPSDAAHTPRKTLTSEDADDLPPHEGTGFQPTE